MVEVVIGGALVSAFVVVMVVAVGTLIDLASKAKRRAYKHRNDPIYERIAKAYEWKAELHLQEGRIEQARDEFRKAEETRREAMEAMMNGQEPKL